VGPCNARRITVIFEVTRDRPELDFHDEDMEGMEEGLDEQDEPEEETVPHAPFTVVVSKKVHIGSDGWCDIAGANGAQREF